MLYFGGLYFSPERGEDVTRALFSRASSALSSLCCLFVSCLLLSKWPTVEIRRRVALRGLRSLPLENDPPAAHFIPGRSSPLLLCNG